MPIDNSSDMRRSISWTTSPVLSTATSLPCPERQGIVPPPFEANRLFSCAA